MICPKTPQDHVYFGPIAGLVDRFLMIGLLRSHVPLFVEAVELGAQRESGNLPDWLRVSLAPRQASMKSRRRHWATPFTA